MIRVLQVGRRWKAWHPRSCLIAFGSSPEEARANLREMVRASRFATISEEDL